MKLLLAAVKRDRVHGILLFRAVIAKHVSPHPVPNGSARFQRLAEDVAADGFRAFRYALGPFKGGQAFDDGDMI